MKANLILNARPITVDDSWIESKSTPQVVGKKFGTQPSLEEVTATGLASRFSKIKCYADISDFAATYGLLGLYGSQPRNVYAMPHYRQTVTGSESTSLWYEQVAVVRRCMRLYEIVNKAKRNPEYDAEEALNRIVQLESVVLHGQPYDRIKCIATGHTIVLGNVGEDLTPADLAFLLLAHIVSKKLQNCISISFESVKWARDAKIGYRLGEIRYTDYPLAAVYYDLWALITEERPIVFCKNCGLPIVGRKADKETCSDACRTAYSRAKKRVEAECN